VIVRLPEFSGDADVQKFIKNLQKAPYQKELINSEMNALRQALAGKGIFSASIELEEKINHTVHTVELVFTIDAKQKREFVFFGNTYLSEKQLLEGILLFGKSAWILPAPLLAQELTKEYHRHGFLQVEIQAQEQTEQCIFIIKEGARVSIKEIVLNGVTQFDGADLIKKHYAPLITARVYNEQLVQECIDALIAQYVTYGYWQCQVIGRECEYIPELHGYRLILDIQEGARSILEKVSIAAPFEKLLSHELFQPCLQSLPTPFCVDVLTCQQEVLKSLLPDAVHIAPEIHHEGTCVNVVWRIKMAPEKSYFGKTVVAYPTTLAEHYLLRELQYNQCDVYSQEKVSQTIGRIKDLGIFETVQLVPEATPGDPYKKMMVLKAVPDDPYELRLRAGLSLQQMSKEFTFKTVAFVGGGTFIVKNPFNHADQACLDVDYTRGLRTIVGKYSRPWIFNHPIKTTFQGYVTQYLQPSLTNEHKNLYEFRQHGFLVGFNHRKNIYEGDINLGFEWMETKIATKNQSEHFVDEVARALNFQPLLLDKRVPFFMLEPTLVVDAVDNKLNPTSGSLTLLRLKGMFPMKYLGLNSYFVKIFIDQSVYFPIYKTVLALRGRAGHIFHHNFSNIMPAERFYLGGANSIRSYDTDLCPPLGVVLDKHCNNMLVPQGAQSMLNLNAELRFPIYKFISGAVFQDLGALSNTMFADIRAKDILAGTGFGVRLNTPIGPLRFDIAWKWRRESKAVSGYSWFLTFGNAF
jgi:outer membrane protein assembly factor BamA